MPCFTCTAITVLAFPCVRNKNVNKEQITKPARKWKWQELPEPGGLGVIANTTRCCWLRALGQGHRARCRHPPSVAKAEGGPSLQHHETSPLGTPQSNKTLKQWSKSDREPWGWSGAGARSVQGKATS